MSDEITPIRMRNVRERATRTRSSSRVIESPAQSGEREAVAPSVAESAQPTTADFQNETIQEIQAQHPEGQTNEGDKDDEEWVAHNRIRHQRTTVTNQPASVALVNRSITRKRTYRYIKRLCRPRKVSKMRTEWLAILRKTDDEISKMQCCSTRKCFSALNIAFLREKMVQYLSATFKDRKKALYSMATSSGEFVFDGEIVCGEFLRRAFRFSLESQVAARRIPSSDMNGASNDLISVVNSITGERILSSASNNHSGSGSQRSNSINSVSVDYILTFIDRMVDETAEKMPDNGELHLPFFRKEDVYEVFILQFKKLYPTKDFPGKSYFYASWKKHRFNVKVRQETRFTKCGTCERLRAALAEAIRRGLPTDDIKKEKTAHNDFVALERREYMRKAELAMLRPSQYLSFVIDGADQSAYTLPHFVTKTKDSRGNGLKVHLIGVLQHLSINKLSLYTMTENHKTGANHIVECVHRFINDAAREGEIPRTVFLQLDNCIRENKNHYLLSYLEALVKWDVFDCVEVGFLPIGHTHCDIDQAFSSTGERLRYHDAITLSDLQHQVSLCYNEKTTVSSLKQIINWSGLCDETRCNNHIDQITQYRYFRFTRSNESTQDGIISTVCHVRSSCIEKWRCLESENSAEVRGILKFLPDLSRTPAEIIECPPGVEEIDKKLDSERARIISQVKMRSLVALKNEVFRSRTLRFHWNLPAIVESNGSRISNDEGDARIESLHETRASSSSSYSYEMGSFVAVNAESNGQGQDFWLGKIVDVHRGKGRKIMFLSVNWYEYYGCTNIYVGRYKPHLRITSTNSKKDTPWVDKISTETVLVSFPKLTNDKKLPAAVSHYLREHFNSKKVVDKR